MDCNLFRVIKDGKTGFINDKGEVKIDFMFDGGSSFYEGLARIFVDDKVGFIDKGGQIKIRPLFDMAADFKEGKAAVEINGRWGYINVDGEIIIELKYYRCDDFNNGLALVMEEITSGQCFIDDSGRIVLSNRDFLVSTYSEGLTNCSTKEGWGFIDINDNFIIPPDYLYTREFSEGKAAVSPKKNENGKPNKKGLYGFINRENQMIIPPIFDGADIKFSEGLCAVWDDGYGYINERGDVVIPCDFDLGMHFSEGVGVFKPKGKNKGYGFLDKSGNIVIEPIFTVAESFSNGLAEVIIGKEYEDFKYGYINKSGEYVWTPTR